MEKKINFFTPDTPREENAFSLIDGYLELDFNVTFRVVGRAQFADGALTRLVFLGSFVCFISYRLTSGSGKDKKEINNALKKCIMFEVSSSSKDSDDLSIGLDGNITNPEKEVTNNKATKRLYHVRTFLKDVFEFAEHQKNATYGLGFILKLQQKNGNHVSSHEDETDAKICCSSRNSYYERYELVCSTKYS